MTGAEDVDARCRRWLLVDPPSIGRSMDRERALAVRPRSCPRPANRAGRFEGMLLRPRTSPHPRVPHVRGRHLHSAPRPRLLRREFRLPSERPADV